MMNRDDLNIVQLKGDWQNHGPFKEDPKFIILHAMGRIINGKKAPYGIHPIASCHFYIDLEGTIFQCVDEKLIAWHAGKSLWKGLNDLNRHSIGIEFLVERAGSLPVLKKKINDVHNPPFTNEQYVAGSDLVAYLCAEYTIDLEDILGHDQVSTIDVRPDPKFDPGEAFDMFRFKSLVKSKHKFAA